MELLPQFRHINTTIGSLVASVHQANHLIVIGSYNLHTYLLHISLNLLKCSNSVFTISKYIEMNKKLIVALSLVAITSFTGNRDLAQAVGSGAVCPAGDVKFEIDQQAYEYTDNSVVITGNGTVITWAAQPGFSVTSICVKIGGQEGGSLINLTGNTGTAGPFEHGISHVVAVSADLEDTEDEEDPIEDPETPIDPQDPGIGGETLRSGTSLANDNLQCTNKEFDAVFDVFESGTPVNNAVVTFTFNGATKEVKTNVDGRAKVQFTIAEGTVIASTPNYPTQSMTITKPVGCPSVHLDPARGQVLGASTMASTGSVDIVVAQMLVAVGSTLSAIGAYGLRRAKSLLSL